jgi:hypothetical protein
MLAPGMSTVPDRPESLSPVILGAGWYALEIAEYAKDANWHAAGLVALLDHASDTRVQAVPARPFAAR